MRSLVTALAIAVTASSGSPPSTSPPPDAPAPDEPAQDVLDALIGFGPIVVDDTDAEAFAQGYAESEHFQALLEVDQTFTELALMLASGDFATAQDIANEHASRVDVRLIPRLPGQTSFIGRLSVTYTLTCGLALFHVADYSNSLDSYEDPYDSLEAFLQGQATSLPQDISRCRLGITLLDHLLRPFVPASS